MQLTRRWTWEFAVARELLWTYLGDTDWVNEHAGLPRIAAHYDALPDGTTRRLASFRRWPFTFAWEERPTLWQAPVFHAVDRIYSQGPVKRFRSRTSLEALSADRTRVQVDVELEAASPLFAPLLPLVAMQGKRGADKAFALAAKLAASPPAAPAGDSEQALREFLKTADNRDVRRMRPYELADRWGLPRRDVLRAFLSATRAGALNLRWSVLCPGCRGPNAGVETLEALERESHCPACNISFDAAFDRSVEVTFDARPLRPGLQDDTLFCIASPKRSAHVHAQHVIAAGARETGELALEPGAYDLNAAGLHAVPFVVSADGAAKELPIRISTHTVTIPHEVSDGVLRVSFENATASDALVRIEEGRWPDTIATAAHVTALQEFRDLFSSEVLSPGLELGIESIAVLFTDLVGSTAMYSRTGDAPAFRIVTDHFEVIREIVSRHEGAIVKTIGDAVMAVFIDAGNCFQAAVELDQRVQGITWDGLPLRLRVGMHAGPCIAMRANERIDYFGTTVNLAARLESLANAGEVTLACTDAQRPDVAPLLSRFAGRLVNEALTIKGFPQPIDAVRLRVL